MDARMRGGGSVLQEAESEKDTPGSHEIVGRGKPLTVVVSHHWWQGGTIQYHYHLHQYHTLFRLP